MWPGLVLLGGVAALVVAALLGLAGADPAGLSLRGDWPYVAAIARFTLEQAALSALLSLVLGAGLALALARRRFPGRRLFLALLGAATALPSIVVVFALAAVYGRAGLVNDALTMVGLPRLSPYGLQGILLGHVFLNGAFAALVFLAALEAVPGEHWRLAASLGLTPGAVFRLIDWPVLRREAPALGLLILLVCATSFAIPLALGGGPGAATLEVAVYQALRQDADFGRAAALALVQVGGMAGLLVLALPVLRRPPEAAATGRRVERPDTASPLTRGLDAAWLLVGTGLMLPPLASVAWSGRSLPSLLDAHVLAALATSLGVALPAALLALLGALALARSRVALGAGRHLRLAGLFGLAPMLGLAVPPLALAAGLYVLARRAVDPSSIAVPTLVLVNALVALPFVHRLVEPPLAVAAERYGRLAASLGLTGLARLRLVEGPLLAGPAAAALAYAMALSLGDLGVVALFGSEALTTLPALLYDRLGAYRLHEAEGLAALLAGLVLVLFLAAARLGRALAPPP